MTTSNEDLDKIDDLEALANSMNSAICSRSASTDSEIAAFCTAASPNVVLLLIARIRELEEQVESLREAAMGEDL